MWNSILALASLCWLEYHKKKWSPQDILDEGEATTLLRLSRRDNRVEFSHQLLQEFFTAYALRHHPLEILQWADDMRWWDTVLMLGGLIERHLIEGRQVGNHAIYHQFVRKILDDGISPHRLLLADALLNNVDEVDADLEEIITESLLESLRRGITLKEKAQIVEIREVLDGLLVSVMQRD